MSEEMSLEEVVKLSRDCLARKVVGRDRLDVLRERQDSLEAEIHELSREVRCNWDRFDAGVECFLRLTGKTGLVGEEFSKAFSDAAKEVGGDLLVSVEACEAWLGLKGVVVDPEPVVNS